MSRIKASNTKPEIIVKTFLKKLRIPFKGNYKKIIGSPDIYIPSLDLVIFIHGCFWHGHEHCQYFAIPKTNTIFWKQKINSNIARDQIVLRSLTSARHKICILWECDFKNGTALEKLLDVLNW